MEKKRFQFLQRLMRRNWQKIICSHSTALNPHHSKFAFWNPFLNPECEDNGRCSCPPRDVPHGFVAVYVGRERKRFVIPALYLNHPVFKLLLEKAREEYGFSQKGGLTMPFEVWLFERFLILIGDDDPAAFHLDASELEQYYLQKYHLCVEKIPMDD